MDQTQRWLRILLVASFALGVAVILLAPAYRRSAAALARGRPEETPIWRSNLHFYPAVNLSRSPESTRHAE